MVTLLGVVWAAVRRVIRENVYHVVPLPGVVWAAVRRELGNPWDERLVEEVEDGMREPWLATP